MTGERQALQTARMLFVAAALAWAAPASAQILPGGLPGLSGGGALPGRLGDLRRAEPGASTPPRLREPPAVPGIAPLTAAADGLAGASLSEVRRLAVQRLLRDHRDVVEADDQGQPVVRGEVLALGVSREALARLRDAGFTVRAHDSLDGLGLETFVLGAPRGQSAVEAVRRLRQIDPAGQYEFNHLYQPAGEAGQATAKPAAAIAGPQAARGLRVGLVDGSAAQSRPALARARLVQHAFAPGGAQVTAHATAVASLIVGDAVPFHGSAPGATLYVADVYGATPTGGSAAAVARALAWLAQSDASVIDISLVGPPNRLLEAAVRAVLARGDLVVAAVGNDGPAAPPLYPAAYPGVVAVTGVDARGHVLPEAGRGSHVDFAAPGSDMAAAGVDGGFVRVRGTSFAAPIVAGRLAMLRAAGTSSQAQQALAGEAVDLGAPGPDPIYGQGLVGGAVRTDPAALARRR